MKRCLNLEKTEKGLHEFHVLTAESTFLVKTFFFLFFGFSINIFEFNSIYPLLYGLLIFVLMGAIRYGYFLLTTFKIKPSSLVFITPRGLISILLFLQLKDLTFIDISTSIIDERVLLVVILSSMIFMTRGTMQNSIPQETELTPTLSEDEIPVSENNEKEQDTASLKNE